MTNGWLELQDVDRVVHEPARLMLLGILHGAGEADFTFLLHETGLTKGNLSSHLMKLEESGYVKIAKTFQGKLPLTLLSITPTGRKALQSYRKTMLQALGS
jgi:DNA-binding MarR family transcriptional regulator